MRKFDLKNYLDIFFKKTFFIIIIGPKKLFQTSIAIILGWFSSSALGIYIAWHYISICETGFTTGSSIYLGPRTRGAN